MKLAPIAKTIVLEFETDQVNVDLEKEMGSVLTKLATSAKTINPKTDATSAEELDEVLDPVTLISLMLAAPKLIEIFSKSLGGLLAKLNKYFKKGSQAADNEMEIAKIGRAHV